MSRVPVASVWISEASPRQYSNEVLLKKIFGTRWRTARRSRSPSLRQRRRRLPEAHVEVAAALAAGDVIQKKGGGVGLASSRRSGIRGSIRRVPAGKARPR